MARRTQFTIGWGMIAIAIIGYFCAFPELAVLLGIFVASILFVSPVFVAAYLAFRIAGAPSACLGRGQQSLPVGRQTSNRVANSILADGGSRKAAP